MREVIVIELTSRRDNWFARFVGFWLAMMIRFLLLLYIWLSCLRLKKEYIRTSGNMYRMWMYATDSCVAGISAKLLWNDQNWC